MKSVVLRCRFIHHIQISLLTVTLVKVKLLASLAFKFVLTSKVVSTLKLVTASGDAFTK